MVMGFLRILTSQGERYVARMRWMEEDEDEEEMDAPSYSTIVRRRPSEARGASDFYPASLLATTQSCYLWHKSTGQYVALPLNNI